jgi:Holliday junction resolvase-like predicted endonuclease
MLESARQTAIKKKMESDGWIVIKLIKTSMNGICDLMCLKNGKAVFVEVKQPKGVLSPIQTHVIETLRTNGFEVNIWTDYKKDYISKVDNGNH